MRHLPPFGDGHYVLTGSPYQEGDTSPREDVIDGLIGKLLELDQAQSFVRVYDVQEVVRYERLLVRSGLGGAGVHAPVDLPRVSGDDLPGDGLSQMKRKSRFAYGGGTNDRDERRKRISVKR
jgi:hypothetical protein